MKILNSDKNFDIKPSIGPRRPKKYSNDIKASVLRKNAKYDLKRNHENTHFLTSSRCKNKKIPSNFDDEP